MIRNFFLLVGILIVLFVVSTGAIVASAAFGQAQKCPTTASGQVRSDKELIRLLETKGLTLTDAEATALVQKPLIGKVENPRVCFTRGLVHLSGNFKLGKFKPSFYLSTGVDLSSSTPKTKDLDIRLGSLPNFFFLSPIERMIEGIINDNLSKAKFEEKFTIELKEASVTIKKTK